MPAARRELVVLLLAFLLAALPVRAQQKDAEPPSGAKESPSIIRICVARVANQSGRILNMGLARQRLARRLDGAGSLRVVEVDSVRAAQMQAEAREQDCRYLLAVELLRIFDTGERTPAGGPLPELDRTSPQPPRLEHTATARFHLSEVGVSRALAERRILGRDYGREEQAVQRAMDEVARRVLQELKKRPK